MQNKPRLGEMLIENGILTQDTLDEALRIQIGGNRKLGSILVRMQALSEDKLTEILAEQLSIELTSIEEEISPNVNKIIPRYICKKYDIIPLKLGHNNTIEIAMADPSDNQTIRDLEQFTGRAVIPRLARHSEICSGIKKHIKYSIKDLFAPQANVFINSAAIILCLTLIISIGMFSYDYIQRSTYGTISKTQDATIYKNHDLMLALNNDGKINLLGRGAYAGGYYSIVFNDPSFLQSFINNKQKDFSEEQLQWLGWAVAQISKIKKKTT